MEGGDAECITVSGCQADGRSFYGRVGTHAEVEVDGTWHTVQLGDENAVATPDGTLELRLVRSTRQATAEQVGAVNGTRTICTPALPTELAVVIGG